MNNAQRIALLLAVANLALALVFPPYEYVSLLLGNVATFDGFHFVFAAHPNSVVNANFLALEFIVVLINGALLWLLFRDKTPEEIAAEQARALAQQVRAAHRK